MGMRLPWLVHFGKSLRLHVLANISVCLFYESMDVRQEDQSETRLSEVEGFCEGPN